MNHWPSLNQSLLIGKVTELTQIIWDNGDVTAFVTLATKKQVMKPDRQGWTIGHSFHQAEITPGERVLKEAWKGAIILVRGELDTFPWLPKGSTTEINRTVLKASGYQLLIPSELERVLPKTVHRTKRVSS